MLEVSLHPDDFRIFSCYNLGILTIFLRLGFFCCNFARNVLLQTNLNSLSNSYYLRLELLANFLF